MLLRRVRSQIATLLQVHFQTFKIVEDEPRIEGTLRAIVKDMEGCQWERVIESQESQLTRMILNDLPLVQIATSLQDPVPIDALERFCEARLGPLLRTRVRELDIDIRMYREARKTEPKRQAYEELRKLDELVGRKWAVRTILGASRRHFEDLEDLAGKYGREQAGAAATLPASQTKHALNRIVCEAFIKATHNRGLTVFEPTQGTGDATSLYLRYGTVVAVEKKREHFAQALDKHRSHMMNLFDCIEQGWSTDELLRYARGKVLMPPQPDDSLLLIPQLSRVGWSFTTIDVDPFKEISEMVRAVLPLLDDVGLLFVSVNEMTPRHGRSRRAAAYYRVDDTPEFREKLWMFDAWRYMQWAAKPGDGRALIPVTIHKCWRNAEQQGIDRIYFIALRSTNRGSIIRDLLDLRTLKDDRISSITQYRQGTIPIVRFREDVDENTPTQVPHSDVIFEWIQEVLRRYS